MLNANGLSFRSFHKLESSVFFILIFYKSVIYEFSLFPPINTTGYYRFRMQPSSGEIKK